MMPRVANLERDLQWYERRLLEFTSSIEGAESWLVLRTSELERRISRLEGWNRFLTKLVIATLSALIVHTRREIFHWALVQFKKLYSDA
jgi:hypothetical protein